MFQNGKRSVCPLVSCPLVCRFLEFHVMRLKESWAQKVQVFALFVLIGIPGPAFCGERHICKTLAVTRPMRSQVIELQKLVNNGHEPWWLDANAVAAQEVLKRENTAKEHYDV